MKKIWTIVLIILIFTSCRTLGSWYGRNPLPQKDISYHDPDNFTYLAERVEFNSSTFDLILINPQEVEIQIEHSHDKRGISLNEFAQPQLLFATNGGMYKEDRTPLGYYSQKGEVFSQLNTSEGYGNFYLKPNGVFFIEKGNPGILETEEFNQYLESGNPPPDLATQSGPLLLYNGIIHPAFNRDSPNRFVRNGVGIIKNGSESIIVFVISNKPVTFYDFAIFFKEFLNCSDALYLDGHISAMYLPALNRVQKKGSFGIVIYALEP